MHISVLKDEAIKLLNIKKDGIYLDLTGGRGGHSSEILNNLSRLGRLIIFDQDEFAYNNLIEKFKDFKNVHIVCDNFRNFDIYLDKLNIKKVDGIIFDLGLSSDQIDNPERGFSYLFKNNLDMRMSKKNNLSALDLLNNFDKEMLSNIFFKYGEEKNSRKIANDIIKERPIKTSDDIIRICDKYKVGKGHSAKKVFQALRIFVNDELESLSEMLNKIPDCLNIDGIVVAISFHSLEDRLVKNKFNELTKIKIDKLSPINIEKAKDFILLTKKAIKPTLDEIKNNKRAKSAILRAVKKIK